MTIRRFRLCVPPILFHDNNLLKERITVDDCMIRFTQEVILSYSGSGNVHRKAI